MSETTALVVAEQPKTHGAIVLKDALREATEQRALLKEYVAHHMVEGTDYGVIPGTKTPTLLKPGAEKLVDLFRCTPKFKLLKCEEDFERGFFNYQFRVQLFSRDAQAVLAEGFGSANSREGRYRWRDANRKCPSCGKEAIIRGKAEYGGGWLCFKKKDGCGAKFNDMDEKITSQPQGKIENDDIATLANTILKMGKKRSLVDGAIALGRCSDLFTQDLEDMPHTEEPAPIPPKTEGSKPEPKKDNALDQARANLEEQLSKQKPKEQPKQEPKPQAVTMKEGPKPAPTAAQAEAQFKAEAASICLKEGHSWDLKTHECIGCGAKEPKQPPALRARAIKVWRNSQAKNMSQDKFQEWAAINLGRNVPSTDWTEDEIGILEVAQHEPPEPGAAG